MTPHGEVPAPIEVWLDTLEVVDDDVARSHVNESGRMGRLAAMAVNSDTRTVSPYDLVSLGCVQPIGGTDEIQTDSEAFNTFVFEIAELLDGVRHVANIYDTNFSELSVRFERKAGSSQKKLGIE